MSSGEAEVTTVRALVRGRVQGVGFRFFVFDRARRLGLGGVVRNLPDGRVKVLARGPRARLEELVAALREGPRMSRIEDLELQWDAPCAFSDEFTIDL